MNLCRKQSVESGNSIFAVHSMGLFVQIFGSVTHTYNTMKCVMPFKVVDFGTKLLIQIAHATPASEILQFSVKTLDYYSCNLFKSNQIYMTTVPQRHRQTDRQTDNISIAIAYSNSNSRIHEQPHLSAWCRSCHVKMVDRQLNETMRIVSGTIRPIPLQWLPVLSHIAPPAVTPSHVPKPPSS